MKRLGIALTAVAALASLTACEDAESTVRSAPEHASLSPGPRPADRFQTLLVDAGRLFAEAATHTGTDPRDAEAANRLLGLDEQAPLRFTELSSGEETDRYQMCLVSRVDTYLAVVWDGETIRAFLSDGRCARNEADAVVAGEMSADTWAKGAAMMGDLTPSTLFDYAETAGHPATSGPDPSPADLSRTQARDAVESDVEHLAVGVEAYAADFGHYPRADTRLLAALVGVRFTGHSEVHAYHAGDGTFRVCVTDFGHGAWAVYDSAEGRVIDSGTGAPVADFDLLCAGPPAALE